MKQNEAFTYDEKARIIVDEAAPTNIEYSSVISGIAVALSALALAMFRAYRKYSK